MSTEQVVPRGPRAYHSPLAISPQTRQGAEDAHLRPAPGETTLRRVYVDAAVLMTAPDAHVQDAGGQDGPSVAYLKKCVAFFQDKSGVPGRILTDIRGSSVWSKRP